MGNSKKFYSKRCAREFIEWMKQLDPKHPDDVFKVALGRLYPFGCGLFDDDIKSYLMQNEYIEPPFKNTNKRHKELFDKMQKLVYAYEEPPKPIITDEYIISIEDVEGSPFCAINNLTDGVLLFYLDPTDPHEQIWAMPKMKTYLNLLNRHSHWQMCRIFDNECSIVTVHYKRKEKNDE